MEKPPRKVGRFTAALPWMESEWQRLAPVLNIVVIEATLRFPDLIEYTAYCEAFSEVADGEVIPNYLPTFSRQEDGSVTDVVWTRL